MVKVENKVQRYESYKDSGVEWLGEIPKHWSAKKLKFIGNIYAGISGKKGDDFSKEYSKGIQSFIPFTNICNNIIIDENQYQFVKIDEKENQNRVLKNDILFLMSSETLDDIAKCSIYLGNDKELYLNSFCKGFRITKTKIYPEYINYLLSSKVYRNYFALVGRGFTRINLKQDFINNATVTLPPLQEQTAIAQFLDDKTTKIDAAIDIKKQQIHLLKERKQVLIHKAVTRGLDDGVTLKDSGVEWIGEIPEGWEVKKLKYVLKTQGRIGFKGYTTSDLVDKDKGALTLGASHLDWKGNIILKKPVYISWKKYYESPEIMVSKGDVIIVQRGSTCGKVALVDKDYGPTTINPSLVLLKEIIGHPQYMFLGIKVVLNGILNLVSKTAIPMLSQFQIDNIEIPFPNKKEQKEISAYIETASQKIETAIGLKQQEIKKLKEYKSSLINGVVTGKVRVC